jgi:hypothetical protein
MDRDDANLRQYKSRSQQPRLLATGPASAGSCSTPGMTMNVNFETPWGGDQVDMTRFRFIGTSPSITPYESYSARRTTMTSMGGNLI